MSELLKTFDNGLLTLAINRPERHNTLSKSLTDTLFHATSEAASDPVLSLDIVPRSRDCERHSGDERRDDRAVELRRHDDLAKLTRTGGLAPGRSRRRSSRTVPSGLTTRTS